MNPYLEQEDTWHDFHERFVPLVADVIAAQVDPRYIVKIDEHIYIHELPGEPRRFVGRVGVWPLGLRQNLPIIPVPLRAPDADAQLDLQAALHDIYDRARYRTYIYDGLPVPPLAPEDEVWARELLLVG